jgi:hypothetical protein
MNEPRVREVYMPSPACRLHGGFRVQTDGWFCDVEAGRWTAYRFKSTSTVRCGVSRALGQG